MMENDTAAASEHTTAPGATGSQPRHSEDSGNPQDEALRVRSAAREHAGGKATSPERDAMYDELDGVDSVGESGSQGNTLGREDQNPIAGNRRR
jgi:hypothetical protein